MEKPVTHIPYHNLILTGYMGLGRTAVGRIIAAQLGVECLDLDTEIQLREKISPEEVRKVYGEGRLRGLEDELCREFSLRRSTVIIVGGQTLLETGNRERLLNSGFLLVLTCALNEILRRLHASQGARFHDPKARAAVLYQVRRERQIHQLPDLSTLDTTQLSVEEVAAASIQFWYDRETVNWKLDNIPSEG